MVPNLSLLKHFDITLLRQKSSKIEGSGPVLTRYWGIVTVPGSFFFRGPRVAGSSPSTLTTVTFVLTLFIFKVPNYMLARTHTESLRVVYPGTNPNPDPHLPRGCPSNSLGPVWANMYSDPFWSTTPAAAGFDNLDCVKWRETLPSQNLQEETSLWDNLLRRYLCFVSRLCRPNSFFFISIIFFCYRKTKS
jgi:hypothetical protein